MKLAQVSKNRRETWECRTRWARPVKLCSSSMTHLPLDARARQMAYSLGGAVMARLYWQGRCQDPSTKGNRETEVIQKTDVRKEARLYTVKIAVRHSAKQGTDYISLEVETGLVSEGNQEIRQKNRQWTGWIVVDFKNQSFREGNMRNARDCTQGNKDNLAKETRQTNSKYYRLNITSVIDPSATLNIF